MAKNSNQKSTISFSQKWQRTNNKTETKGKTYKIGIGGQFPRTNQGRYYIA